MREPTIARVLAAVETAVNAGGRVVLCQILRTEGSTPGKAGWKLAYLANAESVGNLGGGAFEALVKADAAALLANRRSGADRALIKRYYFTEKAVRGEATGMVCGGMAEVMLEVINARPVLAICGGGPVGQALAAQAALCGFDTLIADDREEFLTSDLFPEAAETVAVDREYSQAFLGPYAERDLSVTIVTRCWETDLAALTSVLRQRPGGLGYLGLMGSRRKIQRVRSELASTGVELGDVPLHAPIGLDIGAETPAEIAVSVLAEMIRERQASARAAERKGDE